MRSVLTALCLLATTAHAVPAQFTHQGRLLDADGVPLDGEATITFRITNDETGGDELWEEAITVSLTNGFYSAVLGADDEVNPLDTEVLSQAPVWLELQIDGETPMFPRSAINAVPYATMATVAEEVSGGPVDASQIAVDGTPVVNELGEWVGPAPTVNWSDIEGMPEGFADGVDDDTDTDTDSFAALGTSCLDGDIPVWDGILTEWACGIDNDTVLTDDEVDAIVADNGYAMESELFSSSFLDLTDVPDGLLDGDNDTQLSEADVDAMVSDNGYAMAADAFSGLWSDLAGTPDGLSDGDQDTLDDLDCASGAIAIRTTTGWECTTLLEQLDRDEDGVMVLLDCDDENPAVGAKASDADCDGAETTADCDDSDSTSTTMATDADCDGFVTADDCNDTDAESTWKAIDADCDGTITEEDCDDTDTTSTIVATDPDCDGLTYTIAHTGAGGDGLRWIEHDPISVHTLTPSLIDCANLCDLSADCNGFTYKVGTWSDPNPVFHDKTCALYSDPVPTETAVDNIYSGRMD